MFGTDESLNAQTDELLQVGYKRELGLLYFPPFITQVHTLQSTSFQLNDFSV